MLGITTILTTQAAINIIQAFAFGVTTGAEIYQAANNYDNRKVNN